MRSLTIDDAFAFSAIIDKMGIDTDLNSLIDKGQEKGQDWMGGQIALLMITKIHRAKDEVLDFLAQVNETTVDELKQKKIVYLKELFSNLTKDPQFADFFKSAGNAQK